MEIIIQIVKQLPPVMPRVVVLLVLALLFFIPEVRSMLTHVGTSKRKLERLKQLLELRKLELSVKELQAKNPEAENSVLDRQIESLLRNPAPEGKQAEPLKWPVRVVFALMGAISLTVLGTLAIWRIGKIEDAALLQIVLVDLGVALCSGLIASFIPSRSRWECAIRGFLIPALLGALAVAAMGDFPSK